MPSRFIAPAMRCENITFNSGWTQAGELLRGTQAQITKNGASDAAAIYKVAEAYSARGDKSSALRVLAAWKTDFSATPISRAIRCSTRFAATTIVGFFWQGMPSV
jgi:hypothetical protein